MYASAHRQKTTHIFTHKSLHLCEHIHTVKCMDAKKKNACQFLLTLKSDGRAETETASWKKLSTFQTIKRIEFGMAQSRRKDGKTSNSFIYKISGWVFSFYSAINKADMNRRERRQKSAEEIQSFNKSGVF